MNGFVDGIFRFVDFFSSSLWVTDWLIIIIGLLINWLTLREWLLIDWLPHSWLKRSTRIFRIRIIISTEPFIRLLSIKRDQLLNKIETKSMEADAWIQILNCSTVSELEVLAESLPYTVQASPKEHSLLQEYQKHTTEAQAALFLGQ